MEYQKECIKLMEQIGIYENDFYSLNFTLSEYDKLDLKMCKALIVTAYTSKNVFNEYFASWEDVYNCLIMLYGKLSALENKKESDGRKRRTEQRKNKKLNA